MRKHSKTGNPEGMLKRERPVRFVDFLSLQETFRNPEESENHKQCAC
jgi:hypothetical protein